MRRIALVLAEHRYNKNSVAVLTGAIEVSACAGAVDVRFSKPRDPSPLACVDFTPDLVVLGCSFATAAVPEAADFVRRARREAASRRWPMVTLAGGPHPSGDPEGTLALGFDRVLHGEAEATLPMLLQRLADGVPDEDVPGLWRFEDGAIRHNPAPPPVDLDAYPPFAPGYRRNAPFELSRGCPWACRFCETTFVMGSRTRHRSAERLLHWAEVARRNGNRDLRFLSTDAFAWGAPKGEAADPAALDDLLGRSVGIFGKGHVYFGSFPSEARPEHVTPDLVDVVRRHAANDNIVFGAQSGSDRVLQEVHRGHGTGEVRRAARVVLAAGMKPIVDFICGLPGEDEADREATRALIRELASMGAQVHTHAFMPLPGTPLRDAPPGQIDDATRRLLDTLASQGRHIGRWRVHQDRARRAAEFLKGL